MKRSLAIVAILTLLMAIPSFAQSPRQPTSSEGKTTFTNIAMRGLNATGVPGYIELADTDGDIFYLYIDTVGVLRIASEISAGYLSSPQVVNWGRSGTYGEVGVPVGDQTK